MWSTKLMRNRSGRRDDMVRRGSATAALAPTHPRVAAFVVVVAVLALTVALAVASTL